MRAQKTEIPKINLFWIIFQQLDIFLRIKVILAFMFLKLIWLTEGLQRNPKYFSNNLSPFQKMIDSIRSSYAVFWGKSTAPDLL